MRILFGIIYFFLYRVPEERDIYRGDVNTVMPISWKKSIHNVTQEKKASHSPESGNRIHMITIRAFWG